MGSGCQLAVAGFWASDARFWVISAGFWGQSRSLAAQQPDASPPLGCRVPTGLSSAGGWDPSQLPLSTEGQELHPPTAAAQTQRGFGLGAGAAVGRRCVELPYLSALQLCSPASPGFCISFYIHSSVTFWRNFWMRAGAARLPLSTAGPKPSPHPSLCHHPTASELLHPTSPHRSSHRSMGWERETFAPQLLSCGV